MPTPATAVSWGVEGRYDTMPVHAAARMSFANLVGHRHVITLLARSLAQETLPPSLIFAGPSGVGKFTTAVALARAVNCLDPVRPGPGLFDASVSGGLAFDACGTCRSCVRIARALDRIGRGAEPAIDCLRVLAPDDRRSIKIDRVREVLAASGYRPFDGHRRVVVIDEAERLEIASQNALLKALEEPPPGTSFVLVTSQPDALLPTIRSRCPRMRFGPLSEREIADWLVERGACTADEARAAAGLAGGSIAAALSHAAGDREDPRQVAEAFLARLARPGTPADRLDAAQVLVARPGGRSRKRPAGATRVDVTERLQATASLLRDLAVVSSRADQRWLANADLAPTLARLASAFDGHRVARAFRAVDRALYALDRNVSQKAVADWVAFEV